MAIFETTLCFNCRLKTVKGNESNGFRSTPIHHFLLFSEVLQIHLEGDRRWITMARGIIEKPFFNVNNITSLISEPIGRWPVKISSRRNRCRGVRTISYWQGHTICDIFKIQVICFTAGVKCGHSSNCIVCHQQGLGSLRQHFLLPRCAGERLSHSS